MKKLFAFKRLSTKITFMIGAMVIIVAGGIAGYMQTRILTEIGRHTDLSLQFQAREMAEECNLAFVDAVYRVGSLRNLAASSLDVGAYINDPEGYLHDSLYESLGGYMHSMISASDYLSATYMTLDPNLAGYPFVGELYYAETDDGVEYITDEPIPYEDYQENDPDMEWFFGAFKSGGPYWTRIYLDFGMLMVSYAEPIIINGATVGITGADLPIDHIKDMIGNVRVYDTGFAVLEDAYGEFIQGNDIIGRIGSG